jgi:hypothetical protein
MKKNIVPIVIIAAAAGYYFYSQNQKKKDLPSIDASKDSIDNTTASVIEEKKPKTLLAKAASLVKQASQTKAGKKLISKGKNLVNKKLKLNQMGASYLYY